MPKVPLSEFTDDAVHLVSKPHLAGVPAPLAELPMRAKVAALLFGAITAIVLNVATLFVLLQYVDTFMHWLFPLTLPLLAVVNLTPVGIALRRGRRYFSYGCLAVAVGMLLFVVRWLWLISPIHP